MRGNQRNAGARTTGHQVQFTRTALASACALAVGGFAASGAFAQSLVYTLTSPTATYTPPASTYTDQVTNDQESRAALIPATNANVMIGPTLPGSTVVNNNSALAQAIGNEVSYLDATDPTTIDLFVVTSPGGTAGILSNQIRSDVVAGSAPVITRARNNNVDIGLIATGQPNATSIPVTNNSITSQAQINTADSRIVGAVPTGLAAVAGAITSASTAALAQNADTSGTLNINNGQFSYNASARAGSQARIIDSSVTVSLTDATSPTNAVTLTRNSLAADFGVNASTNIISLETGGAATMTGGMVVSNIQANVEDAGAVATPTANINATNAITANLSLGAATNTVLGGALVVRNNSISTTSTGNSTGNAIGTAVDVNGSTAATTSSVTATAAGTSAAASAAIPGDVLMINLQRNDGTFLDSNTRAPITATVDTIGAGQAITSSRNTLSSAATGNTAANQIVADNSSHDATTALGNVQVNNLTAAAGGIMATTLTTAPAGGISVNVGNAAAVEGAVTTNQNTISSAAVGSAAGNVIDIATSTFTSVTSVAAGGSSVANGTSNTAAVTAGTSISNVQSNQGIAANRIDARTDTAGVAVNVRDQDGGGTLRVLDNSTITNTNNSISSAASGAVAANTLTTSGSGATLHLGVANTQTNAIEVRSRTLDSGVTVNAAGSAGTTTNTVISLTGNTVSSAAMATDAVNRVSAGFSNMTTAAASNPAATQGAQVDGTGTIATANAILSIASTQNNTGVTEARTTNTLADAAGGSFAGINLVGSGTADSDLTVVANNVSATNQANRVDNALDLPSTTNLTLSGGTPTNILSIANIQNNGAVGNQLALVNNAGATTSVGVTFSPTMDTVQATVSQNRADALTIANQATNSVTAAGGILQPTAASTTSGVSGNGATYGAEAEFSLANSQAITGAGTRTATVTTSNIGVNLAAGAASSDIADSSLTVNRNTQLAEARNNDAANNVSLTNYSTLQSTAGLANRQTAASAVAANMTDSRAGVLADSGAADTIADTRVSINNNALGSVAVGSSAGNNVTASSNNALAGGALPAIVAGVTGGVSPVTTADYALANQQTQDGAVTASTTATTRLEATSSAITGTAATPITVNNNSVTAIARATDAVNTMTLNGTGSVSATTGAVGSGQNSATTASPITATVAPATGSAHVVGVDAASITTVPVTVNSNAVSASASRNFAANSLDVTGSSIAGRGVTGAGQDFTVGNTQSYSVAGSTVTADNDPGTVGAVADAFTTNTTTVSANAVTSSANQNRSDNALTIAGQSGVSASARAFNNQAANADAVTARVGNTTPMAIGTTELTAATGAYTTATVIANNNAVDASASRNAAETSVAVSGNTIAATLSGSGLPKFTADNTQNIGGDVAASATVSSIGMQGDTSSAGAVSVTQNSVTSSARGNTTEGTGTSVTLAATQSVVGSALAASTQGFGTATGNYDSRAGGGSTNIGLSLSGTSTGTGVTVSRNLVDSEARVNTATTSVTVSGVTVTGDTGAALPNGAFPNAGSFTARNVQDENAAAGGGITAQTAVNAVGATAANFLGTNTLTANNNQLSATARGNEGTTSATITAIDTLTGSGMSRSIQTSTANTGTANADVSVAAGIGQISAGTINASTVTTNNNLLQADSIRNVATTSLTTATATTTTGTITGAAAAALADDGATASFTAFNSQTVLAAVAGSTASASSGQVGMSGVTLTGTNTSTVSNNAVVASAGDTSATTTANVIATGNVSGSALAHSFQTSAAAAGVNGVSASATTGDMGIAATTAAALTSTVNRNTQTAQAFRNAGTTGLTVQGGNLDGETGTGATLGTPRASFMANNDQSDTGAGGDVIATSSSQVTGLTVGAGGLTGAATVQTTNNTSSALARANSAATTATLTGTGTVEGSGMARSVQSTSTAGLVQADGTPDLFGARVTAAVTTGLALTVNRNVATAEAVRNVASTGITVNGNPISGETSANLTTDGAPASFTATSTQTELAASSGSVANASSATGFGAEITGALGGTSAISVNNNALIARAGTNSGETFGTLTSSGNVTGTAMATSTQTAASATGGSNATATSDLFGLQAASVGALTVTANRNEQTAQAISNAAANSLTVNATTITGDNAFVAGTTASFTANNRQDDNSATGATASSTYGTGSAIGARITGAATGTTVTATNNTFNATARSNSAGTSNALTADSNFSGTALTNNLQNATSTGGVNITHTGGTIGLVADSASAVSVTSSSNTATSEGIRNFAVNSLTVAADSVNGVTVAGGLLAGTGNSFRSINDQNETGATASTVGNTIDTVGVNTLTGNLAGTGVIASDNALTSRARSNTADTSLGITASSAVTGSALSSNDQSTTPAAAMASTLNVTTVGANVGANVTAATNVTTSANTLTAEGRRNVSTNTLTVDGVTVTGEPTLADGRAASFVANNVQSAANAATTTATNTLGTLGLRVAQDVTTSRVTVGNNNVVAIAGGNASTQAATINGSNQITGSALVDSDQTAAAGAHTATINLTTAGANVLSDTVATPVTVTSNTIAAETLRNSASNTLTINGSSVQGAEAAALIVPTIDTPASFTTRNAQSAGAAATALNTVGTLGVNVGATVSGAGNSYTVSDNLVSARAGTNSASNATDLAGVSTFAGTARTQNNQQALAGSAVTATVATTTVGSTIGTTNTGTDSTLAVSRNELNATAVQNTASNSLTGAAATMSATTVVASTPAAYTVGNIQNAPGADAVTATNTYLTIGTSAASATGATNAYSVTENSVFARTGSNSAANTITLSPASGLDNTTTSAIDNTQTSTGGGALLSQLNTTDGGATLANGGGRVGVLVTGAMAAAPITVSNNLLSAEATRNSASNVLNAAGPTIAGGSPATATQPSYAIRSGQDGTGNVTSVNYAGLIGASLNSGAANMVFGVVDNTVLALATMNAATNRLLLDSGSTLSGSTAQGTASVTNTQTANTASTITGTAGGFAANGLNIGVVPSGAAATLGTPVPITVTGNLVSAQGGGNTATNVLEAGATSAINGTTAPNYSFGALNTQTNAAVVNMAVQNTNIGVFVPVAATLSGSAITVSGNAASAIGYGNSASNRVAISGLAGGVAGSAQVVNTQTNTANISASATNLNIGFNGVAGSNAVAGSSIVTNNSVTSRAVGNSATNGITQR